MKLHNNNISNIQAEVFWAFGNHNEDRTGNIALYFDTTNNCCLLNIEVF